MNRFGITLITAAIVVSTVSSCVVSKKKYDALSKSKLELEAEKADCEENLKITTADRDRLNAINQDIQKQIDALKNDTTKTGIALRESLKELKEINSNYSNLSKNHDRLQQSSSAENSRLSKDLQKREKDLQKAEEKNAELQANLSAREARVKELEKVLADKEAAVNELKNKVSHALLNFKEKDLSINVKNGKVYVSLSEQLLFKSGSTKVDPKGIEALKKLAEVLKEQKDISVMVEGHTDDVPVAKGTVGVSDNWDLSVLRATEIVRILTSNGADPSNLIPAGRAENSPVAQGKSAEARQKNRRTEIILTPNLDELFQILESK